MKLSFKQIIEAVNYKKHCSYADSKNTLKSKRPQKKARITNPCTRTKIRLLDFH